MQFVKKNVRRLSARVTERDRRDGDRRKNNNRRERNDRNSRDGKPSIPKAANKRIRAPKPAPAVEAEAPQVEEAPQTEE